MKVAILQSSYQGFFPRFYADLKKSARKSGDVIKAFLPCNGRNKNASIEDKVVWGSRFNWVIHYNLYRITGLQDIFSLFSTIDLIIKLNRYNPDLCHFNMMNEWNMCFPLFKWYLNRKNIPIIWTFHDTRAFTGRCANFDCGEAECLKWKETCGNCPKDALYWPSLLDNTKFELCLRRSMFVGIRNLTIVTPSYWMANHVKESIFKEKDIRVIHNGIDTLSFSQSKELKSDIIRDIDGKIILGVASGWSHRKGLDTMIWLSQRLPENYHIVLVGGINPNLKDSMPSNIICLPRTNSKEDLIAIYQKADVFVNPTLADNFPTVNIEALGAGLPVITFRTGGSAECIDETCGIGVEKGNNESLLEAILFVTSHPEIYTRDNSIKRSKQFSLDQFDRYIDLYKELYESTIHS